MLDAGAAASRSFSYANAGATADNAMADAKAIVTIFTVRLRYLLRQDDVLRARLVTQTRVILKASRITKFGFSFTQTSWAFWRKKEVVGNQPLAEHLYSN